MLETVCVYARPPRNGMSQGDMGRTASSSSSFWKRSQWFSGAESAGAQHPAAWPASKRRSLFFVPDSEAFNSFIGDGFLVPELMDESEVSSYKTGRWER